MPCAIGDNVCNVERLYTAHFQYPVPKSVVESYFEGKGFDYASLYTPQERKNLEEDCNTIYYRILSECDQGKDVPFIVMTAGAPGAGKTTLLRNVLQTEGSKAAYIDPDDVCLKQMQTTYVGELEEKIAILAQQVFASNKKRIAAEKTIRQELYDKWRPGSNAANHVILGNLLKEKRDVFFGTTASSPHTARFFEFLKQQGYRIRLVHVSAPDDVRWKSIQARDKTFVQTTEQDIRQKGDLVPQRIVDTYLRFADEIQFFYRGKVQKDAVLAATWLRREKQKPTLTIHDKKAYQSVTKIHDAVCARLNRPELLWSTAVEKSSRVVH